MTFGLSECHRENCDGRCVRPLKHNREDADERWGFDG